MRAQLKAEGRAPFGFGVYKNWCCASQFQGTHEGNPVLKTGAIAQKDYALMPSGNSKVSAT